jgi:regulator of nucleoside diphosphate kinase
MKNGLSVERTFTYSDAARLRQLLQREPELFCESLASALEEGDVISSKAVPSTLVTMGSTVLLQHVGPQRTQLITLSYPEQADAAKGLVSVLSPIGTAVYGLESGARASWTTPDHKTHSAQIVDVVYQPEASGDLHP